MENKISIGDELAFKGGSSGNWQIIKVDRITPSGRIVCGRFTLNPDLSIRGEKGWGGPYRGQPVTEAIREVVQRRDFIERINRAKLADMPTSQLIRIKEAVEGKESN